MREISLSDATFERLQKIAVPLVDDNESVVRKLLEVYERAQLGPGQGNGGNNGNGNGNGNGKVEPRQFSADSPPSLKHAKLLRAKLNGKPLVKPRWNGLLMEAVRLAKAKASSADELQKLITVNFVNGKKQDEGHQYLADIDLSVQRQPAGSAWNAAQYIARQLGVPIEAEFAWRMKDDAAFPGTAGRLSA